MWEHAFNIFVLVLLAAFAWQNLRQAAQANSRQAQAESLRTDFDLMRREMDEVARVVCGLANIPVPEEAVPEENGGEA